jgi:hypothetical protein
MGVIFPLLVHAIGVVSDIISTSRVKADKSEGVTAAMGAFTRAFWLGGVFSAVAICIMGAIYLRPSGEYIVREAIKRGLYREPDFVSALKVAAGDKVGDLKFRTPEDLAKFEKKRKPWMMSSSSMWTMFIPSTKNWTVPNRSRFVKPKSGMPKPQVFPRI